MAGIEEETAGSGSDGGIVISQWERCQAYESAGYRCQETADERYQTGCVHEHVYDDVWMCARHVRNTLDQLMWCGPCLLGDDPHQCRLLGRPSGGNDMSMSDAHGMSAVIREA